MDLQNLRANLQETLSDFRFSRREKQELREFIEEHSLSASDILGVRNLAFELAADTCDHAAVQWLDGIMQVLTSQLEEAQRIQASEVLFSPRDDCPARIQSLIRSSRESLAVCVFTITDNSITSELLRAHDRGLNVRIISDNDKAEDRGSDVFQLMNAGIPVALDDDGHMHHKFAVFDRQISLTGSYNWTRGAARANHENIVISQDMSLADALLEEFEYLWKAYTASR